MRVMHRIVLTTVSLGLGVSALVSPSAAGADGAGIQHSHVARAAHADGMTGSQLLAQSWKHDYRDADNDTRSRHATTAAAPARSCSPAASTSSAPCRWATR